MNKVGLMRIGAMLATLLVVIGGLAVQPYWNARAETMTVWGIVRKCNATDPVFLQGVTVTLLNAHSTDNYSTSTSDDGSYSFAPPTGGYYLRFTYGNYYAKELTVFRFDGSVGVRRDACLDKMPTRTNTLTVLVVGAVSTTHFDEQLTFAQHYVSSEQTEDRWDPATSTTTTSHSPVVSTGFSVRYTNSTYTRTLDYGFGYTWSNRFAGVLKILDTVISANLNASTTDQRLYVSYYWSSTSTKFLYYPVEPSSYTVYKNGGAWMEEEVNWTLNVDTGVFQILGNFTFGTDAATVNYSSTSAVPSATVNMYNVTASQIIATGFTNLTGYAVLSVWPAILELQVTKDQYQAYASNVDTTQTTNYTNPLRVVLLTGVQVIGHAFRTGGGPPINTGVVGFLYNTKTTVSPFRKVITAKVQGSLYIFYAEAGQYYKMVIDADGYRASETFVSTASGTAKEVDATLAVSLKEEYRTAVTYDDLDWNKVTVDRQLTLRPDSSVPGLLLPGIRSLGLQIDYTLGDRNGNLSTSPGGEVDRFRTWIQSRLPDYVTTSGFLGTNGVVYNSTATSYVVDPLELKPTAAPSAIFINTTASYAVSATVTVPNQKDTYYVNITTPNDTNTTVYQNQVIVVDLPHGYEMTSKKVTGTITTTNWTAVTVDPGVASGTSEIDMTVRESRNGTAAAMVTGPAGKFHVYDDTKTNYTAIVAKDTNITFSASQSTDPIGSINDANFTWKFKNTTETSQTRWGMEPTYNYTSFGRYTVNLTVVEAGNNATYRDIYVYVDDTPPVAVIQDNKTSPPFGVNVNGTTLPVNEDSPVRFNGSASSDIIYTGADLNSEISIPDVEGNRGYEWDFDGDGVVDSYAMRPVHSFEKPGQYNMTLVVVDWVGHRSVAAKLTVIVNDTTKPVANWVILDPADEWAMVTDMMEDKSYVFNASTSSDNYDSNENLTYAWHFPGPVTGVPALDSNGNFTAKGAAGWNITVTWSEFNTSYNVTLNVTDTGFGSNVPNFGNTTVSEPVSVDPLQHPDLQIVSNSLRIEPGQPEENQAINVSFAIQNLAGRKNATHVRIILYTRDANGNLVMLNVNPEWRTDKWDPVTTKQVPTGEKVRIIFTISFPSQGNRSLEIHFNDTEEPYTWVDASNKVTGSVFVKLAGWVLPAVLVVVIVLIVLVAFGLRAYGRYKAGEPIFPRREKKEKKEKGKKKLEEEEEEEEEAEEEDKRGKKRL